MAGVLHALRATGGEWPTFRLPIIRECWSRTFAVFRKVGNDAGDQALLGVVTLEILGLVLHPFKRTLEPMRMLLA